MNKEDFKIIAPAFVSMAKDLISKELMALNDRIVDLQGRYAALSDQLEAALGHINELDLATRLRMESCEQRVAQVRDGRDGRDGGEGPMGPQGPQGPIGPVGATGPMGPPGPPGERGDRGADGPRGYSGPVGPKGDTGDQGDRGFQGPQGPEGPAGEIGPIGPNGEVGERGQDGKGFEFRGLWGSDIEYVLNDVVTMNGSSWVCRADSRGSEPGQSDDWAIFSQRGSRGAKGRMPDIEEIAVRTAAMLKAELSD